MNVIRRTALHVFSLSVLAALSASANEFNIGESLNVAESSINPDLVIGITSKTYVNGVLTTFYSGGVYAGINQLLINGQIVNGFCIDPFHFSSSSSLPFTVVNLANAPKGDPNSPNPSGNGMGDPAALTIEKLWAAHYSATMNANDAATLQLAIWDVVGGGLFSTTATDLETAAEGWITDANKSNITPADLVGLSGAGQDYVVQNVPEGGVTAVLLGLSFVGLAVTKKKLSGPLV